MQIDRETHLAVLAQQIRTCRRCSELNKPRVTEGAPGYGDPSSPVMIVGQSLCGPCMATQVPFTGGSGHLLDNAFNLAEVRKEQLFITNVVHCHPPDNRPSQPEEIENCSEYLLLELETIHPRLVIGLGKDARESLIHWAGSEPILWTLELSASAITRAALLLVPHPSYIRRQPATERAVYINQLASALRWAFGH